MDLTKITTGGAALHHLATGAINRSEFDDVLRCLFDTKDIDWWDFKELHDEADVIENPAISQVSESGSKSCGVD